MLKITAYAERLLNDLQELDWPEKVKKMQTDWIGKSYGAEIDFKVEGLDQQIKVFTTRPDTLYGATFMVLAPEHEIVSVITTEEQKQAVEEYVFQASTKSSVDRMADKDKTGVFTGRYAINPLNGAKILFGFLTMFYPITVQERLCVYQPMMKETLPLLRSLTFLLFK